MPSLPRKPKPLQARQVLGVVEKGSLLDFQVDLSRAMGIAYERCLNFSKDDHSHERMVICAARGATRAVIRDARTGATFLNHAGVVVVKNPGLFHSVRSLTSLYEDLALLPTKEWVVETAREMGFSKAETAQFLQCTRQVKRSPWLDQLLERYLQRRLQGSASDADLVFFERELLRELMLLSLGSENFSKPNQSELSNFLKGTLEMIDAHLFEPLSLAVICKKMGLSRSTLLRAFRAELNSSPPDYIRTRRLEEARRLLERRGSRVEEVALLVGYQSLSAFGRAYKKQFGTSPTKAIS